MHVGLVDSPSYSSLLIYVSLCEASGDPRGCRSAAVVAAEATEQEIARLRREVVELWSGQRNLEREHEELRKAAVGMFSP